MIMLFTEMGLSPAILRGIEALKFEEPTPIQEKVIPVLKHKSCDIIGVAQTGTGKTAAFGLPAIEAINTGVLHPQLLILSPTRELCMQIAADLEKYGRYVSGLKIATVYGGASIENQIKLLKQGVHVVVATPGRIHDVIRRGRINLSGITTLVLDEADEMLKMGFREDLDAILSRTPEKKKTMLFSATMPPSVAAIAGSYMRDPVEITAGKKNESTQNVSHVYHMVHARDRYNTLKRVADYYPEIYGIVFCRTRQETKDVAARLMHDGYNAEALHGDLSQSQRDHVMEKFRSGNISLLVATDVAARGIDVNSLTHVINYNLPDDIEAYTHRSGRTGRAGKKGISVSIINLKEQGKIAQIEKFIRKKFEYRRVPGGSDICERQFFSMLERMRNSDVDNKQINPYMDKVCSMLEDMPKEEIVKRFVSLEFNRFLEYYKEAPDLNADRKERRKSTSSSQAQKSKNGSEMARVLLNVGKGKKVTNRDVIDLIVRAPGARNAEIGKIEIYRRASSVEVEARIVKNVIRELNRTIYKGIRIEAEENYEFSGNDYRDRHKGPRGIKRKVS